MTQLTLGGGHHSIRGYNFRHNYVQVLTLFSAGKLLQCDFNCVQAMFLVYNNPGNLNNVLAMHLVSNSFAFKLPGCLTTSKVMLKAC